MLTDPRIAPVTIKLCRTRGDHSCFFGVVGELPKAYSGFETQRSNNQETMVGDAIHGRTRSNPRILLFPTNPYPPPSWVSPGAVCSPFERAQVAPIDATPE